MQKSIIKTVIYGLNVSSFSAISHFLPALLNIVPYHILLHVPVEIELDDKEVKRRAEVLYGAKKYALMEDQWKEWQEGNNRASPLLRTIGVDWQEAFFSFLGSDFKCECLLVFVRSSCLGGFDCKKKRMLLQSYFCYSTDMKSTLDIISEGMAERGVKFLLIGGMALPAFDVVRQTVDVDCLIASSKIDELQGVLNVAGYKEIARSANFVRYSSQSVYHYDVDVLLVDDDTFRKLMAGSRVFDTGHAVFQVPCVKHMILLKLHAAKNDSRRELKDIGDIVEIIRSNPSIDVDDSLLEMCVQSGPEGVYEKIKGAL